jgi:LAS superfamily LD-carboxypeptidase LdcB
MATLTFVCEAGRNKHGQRLVIVRCSCGSPDFAVREDSFKQGLTKSCGCARSVRKTKSVPASPAVAVSIARADASFDDVIAAKEDAALSAENRAHVLELKMKAQDYTDLDTHKAWNTESTTARKLRQEIARLKVAKNKTQTSLSSSSLSYDEILRAKIASLKPQA